VPRRENSEIALVFAEMADLLEIRGGDEYRIRAFRRTARVIENLPENAEVLLLRGGLGKVPGLGEGSVHRIKQILRTGTTDEHRELRAELPDGLRDMLELKGVGPRTVRILWQNLRISTVEELERAAANGQLTRIPKMGEKQVEKLLRAIADWKKRRGRVPYVEARRTGLRLVEQLRSGAEIDRIALGGSVRRGKAAIGDLDILVAANDGLAVASRFTTLPEVMEVLWSGEGRASVRLHDRQQCDLRILPLESFGAGLHYFTGSQLHNIAVRARANRLGLKISEHGVFRRDDESICLLTGREEHEIFSSVGLPFIAPELRENTGEIEAALAGRLPHLVEAKDLRGDLHMHTVASDGRGTAREMADAALGLGHEYIAITDHTRSLTVANGLDERRLVAQGRHLRDLEQSQGQIRVLWGSEVDILADGSLDLDPDLLAQLDWVIGSVHSAFDQGGKELTDRLILAMETGLVDCIGHPTNRRLGERNPSELELERLLEAARRLDVALEVNGNPYRMDLPDTMCRSAREAGVPLAIDTDAHAPGHLKYQEYGLVTARRGWVEPDQVLNSRSWPVIEDRRRNRLRKRGVAVTARWSDLPREAVAVAEVAGPVLEVHWPDETPSAPTTDVRLDLAQMPISDALRDRIQKWMESGGDADLEAALAERGVPLQVAFGMLLG
jgi:DNA polymerase (family 10)